MINRVTRFGWSAYVLAGLVIVLDQAVKFWVLHGLGMRLGDTRSMAGPVHFTLIPNPGISFGFLRADHDLARWSLVVFSLGVAAMIVYWARRGHRLPQALGYGLIAGGAVGNAIDRARLGWVIDFIDVQRLVPLFPWVFNVADSGITLGVICLLLDSLRREHAA